MLVEIGTQQRFAYLSYNFQYKSFKCLTLPVQRADYPLLYKRLDHSKLSTHSNLLQSNDVLIGNLLKTNKKGFVIDAVLYISG